MSPRRNPKRIISDYDFLGVAIHPNRRMRSLTLARNIQASALFRAASKSLARRRLWLSQAKVLSTTQRRGERQIRWRCRNA